MGRVGWGGGLGGVGVGGGVGGMNWVGREADLHSGDQNQATTRL
jgi:hypothetical protein